MSELLSGPVDSSVEIIDIYELRIQALEEGFDLILRQTFGSYLAAFD